MRKNGIMMQYFEWYLESHNDLWKNLKNDANHLKEIGVTSVWIPPCFKATSPFDTGYGVYDLYDLGEFDQKGSIYTKYGTKDELIDCINTLHANGIAVYADIVLNHKANGDEEETFMAFKVNPENRTEKISEPMEIKAWTKFTFPGRKDTYSNFKWSWIHFSGTDYNSATNERAIYMIDGINKGWMQGVNGEKGNFDYLMFNDIDYKHPDVVNEIRNWSKWFIDTTHVDGFRFDALKHINDYFIKDLVKMIKGEVNNDFYFVGEYWNQDNGVVENYLENTDFELDLFDVRLHFNFHEASKAGGYYDMRQIFDGTLVKTNKEMAVTFVDNHDSQPNQALESFVEPWFKPLAYSLILLREDGYPTLFYGDYYGIAGDIRIEGQREIIDKLLYLRNNYAYGEQDDYFDHNNVVAFTRLGDEDHISPMVTIMSNGEGGEKSINVGTLHTGQTFYDYLGHREDKVTIDENGNGIFRCNGGSVSVYILE